MDFYYEVGSRPALKILVLLEYCSTVEVAHKDIGSLDNKESSMAMTYEMLLRIDDKSELFEPYAIMRYISQQASVLYGETAYDRSVVDQWIGYYQSTLCQLLSQFYDVIFSHKTVTKSKYHMLNHDIKQILQQIDTRLKIHPFLCGSAMTLADISLACDLYWAYRLVITDKYRKNVPYLLKWYERVTRRDEFQKVHGHEWPCKKELVPEYFIPEDSMAGEHISMAGSYIRRSSPMPSLAAFNSERELGTVTSLLAPSKRNELVFDYFKKLVMEEDDKKLKLGMFWNVFDMMGCSIYKFEYSKDLSEQPSEAVQDMLQKFMTAMKAHLTPGDFGWQGIYTLNDKLEMQGVWCFPGKEVPLCFREEPALERYEVTTLNPENEADRQYIEEHWCATKPGDICLQHKVVNCLGAYV